MSSPANNPTIIYATGAVSRNPATDELIATYPHQTSHEVEETLIANAAAFKVWRALPATERVAAYHRLASTLRERSETLASIITAEMGKTIGAARAEIEKSAATIDWIAEHGPAILADEPVSVDGDDQVHVSYLPIGTVLAVMPWNLPIWQVIRASGPIMFSGNGFLLKHAPNVMGAAYALQDVYEAAGFPKGLFANLNADNDTVAGVIADPRVAAITLTGSMRAGAAVASTAAKALKKSLLELGGSDAFIVLADANIDLAVEAGIQARFGNSGQVCLAAKRFILERPIAEEFTRKFVDAVKKLTVGDPRDPSISMGPMARNDLRDEPAGSKERLRMNQWLAFVASELHKTFSPWLFQAEAADSTKQALRDKLGRRFAELDRHLATRAYLTGDAFTAADAYAFTIVNWSNFLKVDLAPYPNLSAYMARVAARPKVREALVAEGLVAAAPEGATA